ncbi:hypothetical protein M0812_02742 [Anaeramoeba flamelloides]|uniref:B box-type domain-containing protein n=1 Tax=Anaeramoeba flamelloides TaxID=1746091 RepID=A0AAV7YR02_9EUKA|nr:hypothetical protein M0812_02742 [Anaeramoeba flamelloides]
MTTNSKKCTFCSSEGVIECKDCPAILCEMHDTILHSLANNKDHKRKRIGSEDKPKKQKQKSKRKNKKNKKNKKTKKNKKKHHLCSLHPNKPVEFYCYQCKKFLCSLCFFKSHRDHANVKTIEDLLLQHFLENKINQKKLISSLEFSQKMYNQLQLLKSKTKRTSSRLQDQIILSFDNLLSAIEEKKKKILQDIEKVRSDKEDLIEAHCEALKESISNFEECLSDFKSFPSPNPIKQEKPCHEKEKSEERKNGKEKEHKNKREGEIKIEKEKRKEKENDKENKNKKEKENAKDKDNDNGNEQKNENVTENGHGNDFKKEKESENRTPKNTSLQDIVPNEIYSQPKKKIRIVRHLIKIQNSLEELDYERFTHFHDPFEILKVDLNPIKIKCQEISLKRKRTRKKRSKSRSYHARERKSYLGLNASQTPSILFSPRDWSDLSVTDNFSTTTYGSSTNESELSDDEWWEREENRVNTNSFSNGITSLKSESNKYNSHHHHHHHHNHNYNYNSNNNNYNNNNNNTSTDGSRSGGERRRTNLNKKEGERRRGGGTREIGGDGASNEGNERFDQIEFNEKKSKKIRVLMLVAQTNESCRENVRKSLQSSDLIEEIRIIKAHNRTPTYEEIRRYDCLFVYSFDKFKDPARIGDLISMFVEAGGGVVISAIEALSRGKEFDLEGRIVTGGFLPIKKAKWEYDTRRELEKFDKNHPILKDVKSFDGGNYSCHLKVKKIEKGANVVAYWSDGTPLICEKRKKKKYGNVVILNFNPLSDEITYNDSYFWVSSTDGAKIMANSIEYVTNTSKWRFKRSISNFNNYMN